MCLHYKQYIYFQCTIQTHFCYCLFNVHVYIFLHFLAVRTQCNFIMSDLDSYGIIYLAGNANIYLFKSINFRSFFLKTVRNRLFNLKGGEGVLWFFVLFRNCFSDNTRVRIFFFCRVKRNFFSPEFNIRLYDKNSESDYLFFPPPTSEYFFQQHWESEYFFGKKNITPPPPPPPLQVKWSFPNIYNVVYGVQCTALFSSLQLSHILCKLSLKSIFILIFDKPVNHKPILSCLHFMLRIYLSNN